MSSSWPDALSADQLDKIQKQLIAAAEAKRDADVQAGLDTLFRAQQRQEEVALCLLDIVDSGHLSQATALEVLTKVHEAHPRNPRVLGPLGEATDKACDVDLLNAPPPEHPLFQNVADALTDLATAAKGGDDETALLRGLATTTRMMARQRDQLAEDSYRRLIELDPKKASSHYNLGLFLKTRGRFDEGMLANQSAADLYDEPNEACEWNLAICATGAGKGEIALRVWKKMKQRLRMGRFGLPEGGYPSCKVRLAQHPLAERTADGDQPGLEETIWIERLSPCHGIVRSVLYQDLGVAYGDVILFDGAPITHHTYGEQQVPVFPHLATLVRSNYQFYDFAGTQQASKQLGRLSEELERDAVVYSHTENYVTLCANCWRDRSVDHEHNETLTKHAVTGRIGAPPDMDPGKLLRQLDAAMSKQTSCHLYVPDLCAAAGKTERAEVESRRFGMILSALK